MAKQLERFPFDPSDPGTSSVPGLVKVPVTTVFPNDNQQVGDELFRRVDAIPPPTDDPRRCNQIFKESYPLRACIDAIVANVATPGVQIEPKVDLDDPERVQEFRDAVNLAFYLGEEGYIEQSLLKVSQAENRELSKDEIEGIVEDFEVSEEDFKSYMTALKKRQKVDKFRFKAFLDNCNPQESFTKIRKKVVTDFEVHGYAFLEAVIDHWSSSQLPTQLNHIPAWTMRLLPMQKEVVTIEQVVQETPATLRKKKSTCRFRLFVQKDEVSGKLVYYKTLGDPRVYSAFTGDIYDSVEALESQSKIEGDRPANAVIHFYQYDPESPYGSPRWLSTLHNIAGVMKAETVNHDFFDNKAIPPGMLLVTGGKLDEKERVRIEKEWEDQVKGINNYHKLAVVSVESTTVNPFMGGVGTGAKVEFIPLQSNTPQDAQFLEYTNRCVDVIGMVYRLGRPVRGDTRDLTKSTARVALQMAEKQVFQPMRNDFDEAFNKALLPALGIHYVKMKSNPPDMTDPEEVLKLLDIANQGGHLTIEESRMVIGTLLGKDFSRFESELGKQIFRVLAAGYRVTKDGKLEAIPKTEGGPGPEGGENNA